MTLEKFEKDFNEFKELYKNGDISSDEYQDLLESLKLAEIIDDESNDIVRKIMIQDMLDVILQGLKGLK